MRVLLTLFFIITSLFSVEFKNELQYESSPYLLQHQSNPIEWFPWGEKAFLKAKQENKAVFLSIGYSTCHWCHVMARESFEDKKIAELFNKYFISVKVDKEEMPHLDSYYQELHLKLKKRSGGWPLSAFLTADKKPFYVATYIPSTKRPYHEGLDTLLPKIYKEYKDERELVQAQVDAAEYAMARPLEILKSKDSKISAQTLRDSINTQYDTIYKGFGKGRKFPEASKIALMMDLAILQKDKDLEQKVYELLDVMALRGLYDHIEGGFFRYCVDAAWEIPHFEKMLYNQAELIPLYVRAYLQTKKELYKNVVSETIAALDKRFVHQGLYYSASDADTNHEEGAFFLYTPKEVKSALKENNYKEEIEESLEFTIEGNFEDKVHLNFYTEDRPKGFKEFRAKLLKKRNKTQYPFIDKKINTAWNAMMIEALYKASILNPEYAKKADKHLEALKELMFDKGELYHQTLLGLKPTQKGLLEDYSFFISALISAYEVTYDEKRLAFAEYLLMQAKAKFYKDSQWYLADDNLNIKADMKDKYYTSPLGKMTQNIIKLASLKESFEYEGLAIATLESLNKRLEKLQAGAPSSAIAFMMQKNGVVTLKNTQEKLQTNSLEIQDIYYPFVLTKKTKTNVKEEYLACSMRSCFSINEDLGVVRKDIESYIRN